jgi:flagellar biosynthetic protein FlhB
MPEEFEERSEQATPRRREQAREKGDVPRSRDLSGILPLWIVFLYLSFGGFFLAGLTTYLRSSLSRGFQASLDEVSFIGIFRADLIKGALILGPLLGIILITVVAVNFIQTGFLVSPVPLTPDLTRLSPLKGLKRIFSLSNLFETAKGVLKLLILGAVLYYFLKDEVFTIPLLADMQVSAIIGSSFESVRKLVLISTVVLTVFAVADFGFQRWQYERNLRMTKQEIKEEMKESEGDPRVRARVRSLQREMARRRMMQEVPKADVVITNPTHYAVALRYDPAKMGAPTIVAKGANIVAERIREIAGRSGVSVVEDRPLAKTLFMLNIGEEIPEDLYKAVAAILAAVYRLKGGR